MVDSLFKGYFYADAVQNRKTQNRFLISLKFGVLKNQIVEVA